MSIVIQELTRSIKYKERQRDEWIAKMNLMKEQLEQYENELIPRVTKEVAELAAMIKRLEEEENIPF
jgi:cysteinyl-tRNA synthetase